MKKQQRSPKQAGVAHVALVLVVLVALAAVGGGIYYALRARGVSIIPSKFNSNCEYNDKHLCRFINNFKEVKNFSAKSSSKNPDGSTTESLLVVDGDDKSQLTTSTNGQENLNTITIGKTTYTKDYSDGKWFKYTETADNSDHGQTESLNFQDEVEGEPAKTTYTSEGTEKCGKHTCHKYKVTTQGESGTQHIWFDDHEYLLRKTRVESEGAVYEQEYSYDKVSISEPSPVKETPPVTPAPNIEVPTPVTEDPSSYDYSEVPTE
jgi:hypothetical protein